LRVVREKDIPYIPDFLDHYAEGLVMDDKRDLFIQILGKNGNGKHKEAEKKRVYEFPDFQ
jgi:hypothetical protein